MISHGHPHNGKHDCVHCRTWYFFMLFFFLPSADIFFNPLFQKFISGISSESQTVRIQIRTDIL